MINGRAGKQSPASKWHSTTPIRTPFLQCQISGIGGPFDSALDSPASPRIPAFGSLQPPALLHALSSGQQFRSAVGQPVLQPKLSLKTLSSAPSTNSSALDGAADALGSSASIQQPSVPAARQHSSSPPPSPIHEQQAEHQRASGSSSWVQQCSHPLPRSGALGTWRLQLPQGPDQDALAPCRLQLPDFSPETPALCESPWVDSAGGLARLGVPHRSLWGEASSSGGRTSLDPCEALAQEPSSCCTPSMDVPEVSSGRQQSRDASSPAPEPCSAEGLCPNDGDLGSPADASLPPCVISETPSIQAKHRQVTPAEADPATAESIRCGHPAIHYSGRQLAEGQHPR